MLVNKVDQTDRQAVGNKERTKGTSKEEKSASAVLNALRLTSGHLLNVDASLKIFLTLCFILLKCCKQHSLELSLNKNCLDEDC